MLWLNRHILLHGWQTDSLKIRSLLVLWATLLNCSKNAKQHNLDKKKKKHPQLGNFHQFWSKYSSNSKNCNSLINGNGSIVLERNKCSPALVFQPGYWALARIMVLKKSTTGAIPPQGSLRNKVSVKRHFPFLPPALASQYRFKPFDCVSESHLGASPYMRLARQLG